MKKVSFLAGFILTAVFVLSAAFSQAQDSIQYQLVIRNSAGQLITNKQVSMKFSLIGGEQTYYQETMPATTDKFGNISVMVGTGKALKGAMKDVPWSTMEISLKVEADTEGGEKYAELGTVPIAAAPYAMYAATAGGNASSGRPKGDEALFEVCDRDGQPVFAVYDDGIVVYIDQNSADKAKRSGLVVTGRKATKEGETADYFAVDAEGTHIYVDDADDNTKAKRSGFVVTGRKATKDGVADSKPYADDRSATKADGAEVFAINGGLTTIYVDDTDDNAKAKRSGFVVTGRKATKARTTYVSVDNQSTNMQTDNLTVSNTIPGADATTAPAPILVVTQTKVEMKTDVTMEGEMIEAEQGIFDHTCSFDLQIAYGTEQIILIDSLLKWANVEAGDINDWGHLKYVFAGEYLVDADENDYEILRLDGEGQRFVPDGYDDIVPLTISLRSEYDSHFLKFYADEASFNKSKPFQFALCYEDNTDSTKTILITVNLTVDKMIYPYGIEKGTVKYEFKWRRPNRYETGQYGIVQGTDYQDVTQTVDYCFTEYGMESFNGAYENDDIIEGFGKYRNVEHKSKKYDKESRWNEKSIDNICDSWWRGDDSWSYASNDGSWDYNMLWPLYSLAGVTTVVYREFADGRYGNCVAWLGDDHYNFKLDHIKPVGAENLTVGSQALSVDKYIYERDSAGVKLNYTFYVYKGLVLQIDREFLLQDTKKTSTILKCTEFTEGVAESSFHRWLKNSGVTNYNGIANDAFSGVEYDENHYYVDLNLPSGNLWAANNVGAPSSYDWGDYLQWGRFTEPKNGTYADNSYDVPNNLTDSPRLTDAAWRWGRNNDSTNSDWCMPTRADWQELIDNCFWVWVKGEQGVRVYSTNQNKGQTTFIDDWETFYSDPEAEMMLSGDYIFLPAAGFYSGSSLTNYETTIDKMQGYYWAADKNSDGADCIAFGKQYKEVRNNSCFHGLQVRAVAHKNTKYWVKAGGSNNGNGSEQQPFNSIVKAIRIISQSNGDEKMTYTIMINGQLEEPTTINLGNVKQITLCGVNGLDNNGEPQDAIVGNDGTRPLTVSSGNIIINNLKLTGGNIGDGGGLLIQGAKVTLDSGALITENNASSSEDAGHGGGVCVGENATLVMLANSKISNNTVGNESYNGQGAGVYMSSNPGGNPAIFNMYGGEISENHGVGQYNGTGSQGGGVYIGQNADFTMSGGRITGNELNGICMGGGVYQILDDYNSFRMLGGEISDNTSTLYNGLCFYQLGEAGSLEIGGNAYANAINCLPNNGDDVYIRIVSPLTTDKPIKFYVSNNNASGVINLTYSTPTSAEYGLSVLEDAIGKLGLSTDEYTVEYSSKNEEMWFECEAKLTPKQ